MCMYMCVYIYIYTHDIHIYLLNTGRVGVSGLLAAGVPRVPRAGRSPPKCANVSILESLLLGLLMPTVLHNS